MKQDHIVTINSGANFDMKHNKYECNIFILLFRNIIAIIMLDNLFLINVHFYDYRKK